MHKKFDFIKTNSRIADLRAQLKTTNENACQANAPRMTPLRLELNLLLAQRALYQADARYSRHFLREAWLRLNLAVEDAQTPPQDVTRGKKPVNSRPEKPIVLHGGQCLAIKANGQPCTSPAIWPDTRCGVHRLHRTPKEDIRDRLATLTRTRDS